MKTRYSSRLVLAGFVFVGFASLSRANLFTDNFDALVVAERAKDAPKDAGKATTYVAFDGGYVEAGDPIAGDTPPTADQVRQGLTSALAEQGFQSAQTVPALVLTYHWGVLRVDHMEIRVPYQIKRNWSARVALVSTQSMDEEIENHVRDREHASGENLDVASPRFLTAPLDSAVERARLPRIFLIVSAYDYDSLFRRHEAKLVWRTKLSAQETSGSMEQVIPSLIEKGAPYFGKDLAEVVSIKATLAPKATPAMATAYSAPQTPESFHLDRQVLNSLFRQEQIHFTACDPND